MRERVAGHRLDVNIAKAAALFEGTDEQDILKYAAGEAERVGAGRFAEVFGELQDDFFQDILGTASERGAYRAIGGRRGAR